MQGGSKGHLFSMSKSDPFTTHIMKDIDIKLGDIDVQVYRLLFVFLPTYYTKALYFNSDNSSYMKELEETLIMLPLNNCYSLKLFYTTWTRYNPVKKEDSNLVPETEKSKTLKKLISANSIFKTIYLDRIVKYNDTLRKMMSKDNVCAILPIIPETFKEFYNTSEIKIK